MNGVVCNTPSKFGQCVQLLGHTGNHRSSSGHDWGEDITWSIQKKKNIEPVKTPVEEPIKRGRGRPRKWFTDENGKRYKKE